MAGGAADTAGTAADGTVIIDSELGVLAPHVVLRHKNDVITHAMGDLGDAARRFVLVPARATGFAGRPCSSIGIDKELQGS
jgi:hypothetical protein